MMTTTDAQGNIVCIIHRDASVMTRDNECSECLDDAHEQSIIARNKTIASATTYVRPSWSSDAKYGAQITWSDGSTTCCSHSHKTEALAARCLSKWLQEMQSETV